MTTTDYFPRPIAGQTFKGHTKVSMAQIRKLYASGQKFTGFIVGNKVAAFHFFGGWHLAYTPSDEATATLEGFENTVNSFLYYLDSQLGTGAAFYLRNR